MIEYHGGDLFASGAQALVNTVNCFGVMGAGLALEFKRRYPAMFRAYNLACSRKQIKPGVVWPWHEPRTDCCLQTPPACHWVMNFPTKLHWRNPSKLEWIRDGLDDLRRGIEHIGYLKSIAVPALGCQNGKLSWELVRPLIEEKLGGLDVKVMVYGPR